MEILYLDANREATTPRNLAAFIRTHQAARERTLLEKLEGLAKIWNKADMRCGRQLRVLIAASTNPKAAQKPRE